MTEELHFGRAATRLRIAQPPLSQAIRKLEDELGVQLLNRTSRVVTQTEAGRVFAEEARKVVGSFTMAVAEARRAGGTTGPVRIGCLPDLAIESTYRFLGELREQTPGGNPFVIHLPSLEQVRRLRAGELDFGLIHDAEDYGDLEMEPLFPGEALRALLPRDHPLTAKRVLRPADLRGEALVLFARAANPALHDRLLALIETAGYRFRAVHEAGGANRRDVILAVAGGRGVAVGPFSEVARGAEKIVTRRRLDPSLTMPDVMVAWRVNPPRRLRSILPGVRELARRSMRPGCDGATPRAGAPPSMDGDGGGGG